MAFWKKKRNWEDEYDEYYAQDRRLGNDGRKGGNRLRFFAHGLTLIFVGAIFTTAVGVVSGRTMVEKLLIELAMPIGLVWLGLIVMIYFCLLNRQAWPALVGLACWLVLTVSGNSFVSNWMMSTLEAPYQELDIFEIEPLDSIVLLGGATNSRIVGGRAQLSNSGDRVAIAAELFHAGQTKQIICTGSDSFRAGENDQHPREEAAEILVALGVPTENISQLQGKNTSEEMQNLKKLLDNSADKTRIGLVTSAWHLPRAMRLAKSNGLDLIPVPANFLSQPVGPNPNLVVPGDDQIYQISHALKEYLARIVGR